MRVVTVLTVRGVLEHAFTLGSGRGVFKHAATFSRRVPPHTHKYGGIVLKPSSAGIVILRLQFSLQFVGEDERGGVVLQSDRLPTPTGFWSAPRGSCDRLVRRRDSDSLAGVRVEQAGAVRRARSLSAGCHRTVGTRRRPAYRPRATITRSATAGEATEDRSGHRCQLSTERSSRSTERSSHSTERRPARTGSRATSPGGVSAATTA